MSTLDEDTRVFSLSPHWARELYLGIPPFISDPGNLCLLDDRSFVSPCIGVLDHESNMPSRASGCKIAFDYRHVQIRDYYM